VVTDFMALREQMKNNKSGKLVSTSELLDWVKVLQKTYADKPDDLPTITEQLLFPSVLLKTLTDYTLFGPAPDEEENE